MKKIIFLATLISALLIFCKQAKAQHVKININVEKQPVWSPLGYDYVSYYYLPEIGCYYDVNRSSFIYLDNRQWIRAKQLPYSYSKYDIYKTYKVVINNIDTPWKYHQQYRTNYEQYSSNRHRQSIICDSKDLHYRNNLEKNVIWYSNNNQHSNRKRSRQNYVKSDVKRLRDDNGYSSNKRKNTKQRYSQQSERTKIY